MSDNLYHLPTNLYYLKYLADSWGDPSKKVWITEFGWRLDEATKANYLVQTMDICRRTGVVDMVQPYVGAMTTDSISLIYDDGGSPHGVGALNAHTSNEYCAC